MTSTQPQDPSDLLSHIIGLQLLPANVHHLYGLSKLAAFIARSMAQAENVPVSLEGALESFQQTTGGDIAEDGGGQFEHFVTTEVPYFSRTFRALQGIDPTAGSDVLYLLLAVFGEASTEYPEEFSRKVRALASFLLSLSNYLSLSFGFDRHGIAPNAASPQISPSAEHWHDLAKSIRFSSDELFDRIPGAAAHYLMNQLWTPIADLAGLDLDQIVNRLIRMPLIIDAEGAFTIGAPRDLMATLRYQIIAEAEASSCLDLLHKSLCVVALNATQRLISPLFDSQVEIDEETLRIYGIFDSDKTLDVYVHVPPLEVSADDAFPQPLTGAFAPADDGSSDPSKRLTLDILWPMGRDLMVTSEGNGLQLLGSFDDFEMMLFTPGTDQLTLWYFAKALARLEESTQVLHAGITGVYGLWIENNHSFYFSDDDPPPTLMYIESDYAVTLRRTFSSRIGRAYVHIANRVHEANLRHGSSTTVRAVMAYPRHFFSVEIGDRTLWAELTSDSEEDGWRLHTFPEAVCYWAEVLDTYDDTLFEEFEGDIQLLIKVTDNSQWDDGAWIRSSDPVQGKNLVFELRPPQPPGSEQPPNQLDRQLLAHLVRTLLTGRLSGGALDREVEEVVDVLAPPGERRMIHVVEGHANLVAWPGDLPYARKVESAVIATLLDGLGQHLREACGRSVGNVDSKDRSKVLNKEVVPFFGDQLTERLNHYPRVELLKKLIIQNEALIHEEYSERIRYPSRLACFGASQDEVERLGRHLIETNTASVCSRFLIEFASALHPSGGEELTDEGYDLLLALASEVVNKGFLSDAIHAGISHAELSILPSGRLGISRDSDRYTRALNGLMNSVASAAIDEAVESAVQRAVPESEPDDSFAEAEELAIAEFGFSYTQLSLFCSELVNLSHEADQTDVGILMVAAVADRMRTKFGWQTEIVDSFFDQLTLEPLDDFWSLGADVMPWRYNRARSYLRQPLIRWVVDGADTVIFGHRNVIRTSFELHGQHLSGRLKAKTPAMKEALSRARDQKGEDFEQQVEFALQGRCHPVVRRADKFGALDLHDVDGLDLGDIDVLAFCSASNTLYVIEAKSLLVARTPRELQNEMSHLVEGEHSAVERLRGRYDWVLANRAEVFSALDIENTTTAAVKPLIVIDSDLLSARFESPFPIVTLSRLGDFLDQQVAESAG